MAMAAQRGTEEEREAVYTRNPRQKIKDSSEDCNFGVFNVIPNAMTLHAPKDVKGSNQCKSSEGNAIRAHHR